MGTLDYECVIVGGGPAGLSAAIYMGRFRRNTLLIDRCQGRWIHGQRNDNYLGFPNGVSSSRLRKLGEAQACRFGIVPQQGSVDGITLMPESQGFKLATTLGQATSRTVIWAAGVRDRWPTFKGAKNLVGKQLFWCIVCDGYKALGQPILLLGKNNLAAEDALQFLTYTSQVTLLIEPGKHSISAEVIQKMVSEGIQVLTGQVKSVQVSNHEIDRVVLNDGRDLKANLIFSLYGSDPNTEILEELPIELSKSKSIVINEKHQTNLEYFYAAGDVTNPHSHQVAAAVYGGAQAAQAANYALYPARQRLDLP